MFKTKSCLDMPEPFKSAIPSGPAGTWHVSADDGMIALSRTAQSLLGTDRPAIAWRSLLRDCKVGARRALVAAYRSASRLDEPYGCTVDLPMAGRGPKTVRVTIMPAVAARGGVTGIISPSWRDADNRNGVAQIANDLLGPLNTITGCADLLIHADLPDQCRPWARAAARSAQSVQRHIENVMIAIAETDACDETAVHPIDLATFVDAAASRARQRLLGKGLTVLHGPGFYRDAMVMANTGILDYIVDRLLDTVADRTDCPVVMDIENSGKSVDLVVQGHVLPGVARSDRRAAAARLDSPAFFAISAIARRAGMIGAHLTFDHSAESGITLRLALRGTSPSLAAGNVIATHQPDPLHRRVAAH